MFYKLILFTACLLGWSASATDKCRGKLVELDVNFKWQVSAAAAHLKIHRSPLEGLGNPMAEINSSLKNAGFSPVGRKFTVIDHESERLTLEIPYKGPNTRVGITDVRFVVHATGLAPSRIVVNSIHLESFGSPESGLDAETLDSRIMAMKESPEDWRDHVQKVRDRLVVPEILHDPYVLEVALGDGAQWGDIEIHVSGSFVQLVNDILLHSVAGAGISGRVLQLSERLPVDLSARQFVIVYSSDPNDVWAVDRNTGQYRKLYLSSANGTWRLRPMSQ